MRNRLSKISSCHIPYLKGARLTPKQFYQLKEQYRAQLTDVLGR